MSDAGGVLTRKTPPLVDFVTESNLIEGIRRLPTDLEIAAHDEFLRRPKLRLGDVERFVRHVADAPLRREPGMNVRVGRYFPPPGGPDIPKALERIIELANDGRWTAYDVHVEYETLHPFMDGNGRSGRVLWLWMMLDKNPYGLPFLHQWYYQTLDASRSKLDKPS